MATTRNVGPHTGIYQRVTLSVDSIADERKLRRNRPSTTDTLAIIERSCKRVFDEYIKKPWPTDCIGLLVFYQANKGPGPRLRFPKWIAALERDLERWQFEQLLDAVSLADSVRRLRAALEKPPQPETLQPLRIAQIAMNVGRLYERLQVRFYEPDVMKRKGSLGGVPKSHVSRRRNTETRYQPIQAYIDEIRLKRPSLLYQAACRNAATKFGLKPGTIEKHTVNRTPRRPKKS